MYLNLELLLLIIIFALATFLAHCFAYLFLSNFVIISTILTTTKAQIIEFKEDDGEKVKNNTSTAAGAKIII